MEESLSLAEQQIVDAIEGLINGGGLFVDRTDKRFDPTKLVGKVGIYSLDPNTGWNKGRAVQILAVPGLTGRDTKILKIEANPAFIHGHDWRSDISVSAYAPCTPGIVHTASVLKLNGRTDVKMQTEKRFVDESQLSGFRIEAEELDPNDHMAIELIQQLTRAVTAFREDPKSVAIRLDMPDLTRINELIKDGPQRGIDDYLNGSKGSLWSMHDTNYNTAHAQGHLDFLRRAHGIHSAITAVQSAINNSSVIPNMKYVMLEDQTQETITSFKAPVLVGDKLLGLAVNGRCVSVDNGGYYGFDPFGYDIEMQRTRGTGTPADRLHFMGDGTYVKESEIFRGGESIFATAHNPGGNGYNISMRSAGCHLFRDDQRFKPFRDYWPISMRGHLKAGPRTWFTAAKILEGLNAKTDIGVSE